MANSLRMEQHSPNSAILDAVRSLRELEQTTDQDLFVKGQPCCELLKLVSCLGERLRKACELATSNVDHGRALTHGDTEMSASRSRKSEAAAVAEVLLPVIKVLIGNDVPLIVQANWNPSWRARVEGVVDSVNQQIRDGKYGFVDDCGHIFQPSRLERLDEAVIRAVAETIASKLKEIAIPIVEPPATLHTRIANAKRNVG